MRIYGKIHYWGEMGEDVVDLRKVLRKIINPIDLMRYFIYIICK